MMASGDRDQADNEPLGLVRCAEISAHLAHFPRANHAEVVARFGLRWQDWEAASARWASAREVELAAGQAHVSSRFVRAFVATSERLLAQRASLESIGPLPFSFRIEATPYPEVESRLKLSSSTLVEATQVLPGAREIDAPSFWISAAATDPSDPSSMPRSAGRYLAETAAVSGPVPVMSLPFVVANAAPEQALNRAMAHAEAVRGPRSQHPAVSGSTVALSDAAPAPAGAGLTMEQYTSLRVELQLLPDHTTAILARYGVRPEGREALFAHWRSRFESDPPLRMLFARGYGHYLGWFRENPAALEAIAESVRRPSPR